eukprot:gene7079-7876_t
MAEKSAGKGHFASTKRKHVDGEKQAVEGESDNKKSKYNDSVENEMEWSEEMDLNLIKYMEENCQLIGGRTKFIMQRNIKWSQISDKFLSENGIAIENDEIKRRWENLTRKVRRTRTVPELLKDVKEYLNLHLDQMPEKKPLSSFQLFCMSKRRSMLEKYPAITFTDISKRLGKKWRELPAEKKSRYERKAMENKEKYDEEVKKWQDAYPDAVQMLENGKKKAPAEAKVHIKPFDIFCKKKSAQLLAKYPDLDEAGLKDKVVHRWEKLKDSKKEKYIEKAKAATAEANKTPKKNDGRNAKKNPRKLKKPLSAYNLYSIDQRKKLLQENAQLDFSTLAKMIGASWKDVSEEDRNKYKELASTAKKVYEEKMREFRDKNQRVISF